MSFAEKPLLDSQRVLASRNIWYIPFALTFFLTNPLTSERRSEKIMRAHFKRLS